MPCPVCNSGPGRPRLPEGFEVVEEVEEIRIEEAQE